MASPVKGFCLNGGKQVQTAEYMLNVGRLIGVTPPAHSPAHPAQSNNQ